MSDAPTRPEARAPRGFPDRRAAEIAAERRIVEAVSQVYERYGFEPLETSAFETVEALGKFLPDSDRPNEGVFALRDDDESWIALRYDLTAPLARFVAERWDGLPKPFRRYAVGPVWRNEKPGPGRFRQFVQCDADTVGSARPEADAEMIALAGEGLRAAGLGPDEVVVKVNDRQLLNGLLTAAGVLDAGQRLAVLRAVDKLDRLGLGGVRDLLGRGRLDESGAFTPGAELPTAAVDAVATFVEAGGGERAQVLDRLDAVVGGSAEGAAGLERLRRIDEALRALGVDEAQAVYDPAVVRGLEYYTGPVFEAELTLPTVDDQGRPVRYGSIGGGGRYDDLVARFTGQTVPATGFSFGVSRLAAALEAAGRFVSGGVRGPVVVLSLDREQMADSVALAAQLRAGGVAAEVYLGESGMRAQLKYADRRSSPAAVIVGSEERAAGTVTIKDLDLGRRLSETVDDNAAWRAERPGQVTVARDQLVAHVRGILAET